VPGGQAVIGYYNTFTAVASDAAPALDPQLRLGTDPAGRVAWTRGPGFASAQGHLESVLSVGGRELLLELVAGALTNEPVDNFRGHW